MIGIHNLRPLRRSGVNSTLGAWFLWGRSGDKAPFYREHACDRTPHLSAHRRWRLATELYEVLGKHVQQENNYPENNNGDLTDWMAALIALNCHDEPPDPNLSGPPTMTDTVS